jgi:hypothetical protein
VAGGRGGVRGGRGLQCRQLQEGTVGLEVVSSSRIDLGASQLLNRRVCVDPCVVGVAAVQTGQVGYMGFRVEGSWGWTPHLRQLAGGAGDCKRTNPRNMDWMAGALCTDSCLLCCADVVAEDLEERLVALIFVGSHPGYRAHLH